MRAPTPWRRPGCWRRNRWRHAARHDGAVPNAGPDGSRRHDTTVRTDARRHGSIVPRANHLLLTAHPLSYSALRPPGVLAAQRAPLHFLLFARDGDNPHTSNIAFILKESSFELIIGFGVMCSVHKKSVLLHHTICFAPFNCGFGLQRALVAMCQFDCLRVQFEDLSQRIVSGKYLKTQFAYWCYPS